MSSMGNDGSEAVLAANLVAALLPLLSRTTAGEPDREYRKDVPLWGDWEDVRRLFKGIAYDRLQEMVARDWVKRHKSTATKQGKATYCIADIDRVYRAQRAGKTPRKVAK